MKPATKARQALLASLIVATSVGSTGCSTGGFSLASMNPFSNSSSNPAETGPGAVGSVTETLASTGNGARNQLSTMGTTTKSAMTKTRETVAGMFTFGQGEPEEVNNDPLSLANKPKSISPEVFVANGQLWESTGNFKKAMESYGKALASEPNNGPALTSIARLHFRQGNHKQAAEYFRRAIEQTPNDAGLYNDLGLTLSKLGDHGAATQSLQRSLQLAPGTSRYANNLASITFESGNADTAFQVLARNNKPAVAHFNMAYLHFKSGQLQKAKAHLGQALQFEPQASGDAAVQRAVERSRDMLAQIDASMGAIAQAAPQATIAAGNLPGEGQLPVVQQTSQTETTAAAAVPDGSSTGVATSHMALPATPSARESTTEASTRKMPIKPTATGPAPSVPFAMPGSFSAEK